jgi:general secretion pathway protein I
MAGERGFTLVEVLVALAIVAVALTAALRASAGATDSALEFRQRLLAGWVAENRLAEYSFGRWPEIGEQEGAAEQAETRFRWRETVAATSSPLFRRVEVRVYASGDTQHVLAHLIGYASRTP